MTVDSIWGPLRADSATVDKASAVSGEEEDNGELLGFST